MDTGWVDASNTYDVPDNYIISATNTQDTCDTTDSGESPSYDACSNNWTRQGPDGYCDGSGSLDTDDALTNVSAGNICFDGSDAQPNATRQCGTWGDCVDGNTSADEYWVGYAGDGSEDCVDDNWQASSTYWNATAGYEINVTEHADDCQETVAIGTLNITWIIPTTDDNHTQNEFKEYSFNVSCAGGTCGNVNVTLDPIENEVIWKDNCQTKCIDGKCNTILGRTVWVNDSDGTCKPIEQASSLKNGFYIEYLEKDPSFNLTVSEFNISYMDMTLDFVGNPADYPTFCQVTDALNAKCDFKIDEKWNEYDVEGNVIESSQLKFQYKWELKQGVVIKGDKVKYEYKENVMGKKFSFGGNSTTIILQDADTENLDDAYAEEADAANEFGANGAIYAGLPSTAGNQRDIMVKFYISLIPLSSTIEDCTVCLEIDANLLDADNEGYNISVNHVYPFPLYNISDLDWTEGTGNISVPNECTGSEYCWDTKPTTSLQYNLTFEDTRKYFGGTGEPIGLECFDVTNMVSTSYNDNDKNLTILFSPHDVFGSPGTNDFIRFFSKEDGTAARRPYLNITYSEEEPPPPTKGIINNTAGSVPFYHNHTTIDYECGSMSENDVCNATFWVNATGEIDNSYDFFATASSDNANVDSINSSEINITTIEAVPEDTCTCPGDASAHEFDCSDECDVGACTAGDITFTGTGFTRCNGTWAIDSLGDPGSGCILWIDSDCYIDE